MRADEDRTGCDGADGTLTLAYLESRVRQEADAAARAASIEATLVHVVLATAYAKRLNACSNGRLTLPADSWVQEHRLW